SWGWGNFLVPLFHCFRTPQGPFFQHTQEFFGSYYLGVGLLTLAGWAIWKARDARVLILAGLSIAAVLLALGENGFLFPIIKRIFPIAGIARYPVKFLILPAFALPMIAAFAIARLESREQTGIRDQRSLMLTAMVTLALIALVLLLAKLHPLPYDQWLVTFANGMFRALFLGLFTACLVLLCRDLPQKFRTGLVLALLVIIFADARTHTPEQNPSVTAEALAPGLWQARGNAPGPQRGESRVFITPSAEQHLLANNVARPIDQLLGQRLALWSNLHLLDGVAKVNGSSTLQIREQKQLEQRLYEVTNSLPAGLLDFLAVSHISSAENLVDWVARSNYCALVTAGQRPEFADEQAILRSVTQPDFNPRTTVFLPLETKASIPIGSCRPVQINELQFSSQRVGFNATAAEPAVCVIAQSFYHCWKASIDGQPVRLLRANGAFQAVIVPAGSHQVVLRYQDGMFWTGVAISLASLAICGILWRCTRPKLYSEDFVVSGLSSAPME
ncbi:MAG TPA: hypothetical protein VKM56_13315, partial [Verrucomicrobiae bacterium]|nr:hypothetical protein [Verrucomicrobiae bacterium]